MTRTNRLIRRGLTLALLTMGATSWAQTATLALTGGRIYTVDSANRVVEAVAIAGDRIVRTGTTEEIRALCDDRTQIVDLGGRAAYPGFIDAHGHLSGLGGSLQTLDLVGTPDFATIVALVKARAKSLPNGVWITGRGWDQNDWPNQAFPRHDALSAATPNNPVVLTRVDGHASLVNAAAMAAADLDGSNADPPGGRILRDDLGAPTGLLIDTAQGLVGKKIPAPSRDQVREGIALALARCVSEGLTSVHDAGVTPYEIALYKTLIDEGAFDLRVYAMLRNERAILRPYFERGPLIGYGDNRLTVRAVKAMADGALGSRGAALLADYDDEAGNRGLLITDFDALERLTEDALRAGFQVCTHAIGDRANRTVLDAYEAARKAVPEVQDPRLRMEHAQIVSLADIPRFAALGVIPSMQATHATSDMYWAEERVGPERIQGAYAWRRFLDAGCRIANGSDFPVENTNPLWGIYAAIARQDHTGWPNGGWRPEDRMTREEALRSFTMDAAYAAFQEDLLGSIEPGKLADIVVLSNDVMTVASDVILSTRVETTVLGGKLVYTRTP